MGGSNPAEASRPELPPTPSLEYDQVEVTKITRETISAPQRILMAPGPSNIHPRVLQALIEPLVGHKDPYFLDLMEATAGLLRRVFCTANAATFALPGTGGSGMEAALINALEPGDTVVIGKIGRAHV